MSVSQSLITGSGLQSQLCSVWSAFSQPYVALGIQTKHPMAVESVNLLVLVDEDSLFNSCCADYLLRPKICKECETVMKGWSEFKTEFCLGE